MAQLSRVELRERLDSFMRTHHVEDSFSDLIDSMKNILDDPDGGGGELGYDVYAATLTQSGTGAPVATVLTNTLGGTVVWSRNSLANYRGTLTGAFPTESKIVFIYQPIIKRGDGLVDAFWQSANEVNVVSYFYEFTDPPVGADSVLFNFYLEIRRYP